MCIHKLNICFYVSEATMLILLLLSPQTRYIQRDGNQNQWNGNILNRPEIELNISHSINVIWSQYHINTIIGVVNLLKPNMLLHTSFRIYQYHIQALIYNLNIELKQHNTNVWNQRN